MSSACMATSLLPAAMNWFPSAAVTVSTHSQGTFGNQIYLMLALCIELGFFLISVRNHNIRRREAPPLFPVSAPT